MIASRVLCIMAHEGAQGTIDQFMPKWRKLGVPVVASVPEWQWVNGFDAVYSHGKSSHSGYHVFERFLATCNWVYSLGYEEHIIAEYDTVCLQPDWICPPGKLTCGKYESTPHNQSSGELQDLFLSPWCMDRATLRDFTVDMYKHIRNDPDGPRYSGMLDRWIGGMTGWVDRVQTTHKIESYPMYLGAHDRIQRLGVSWVHGWKDKSQFGELWQEDSP
jgi:hypothetical protein